MILKNRYGCILLIFMLLISLGSFAQKKEGTFHVQGTIRVEKGDATGAVVNLKNLTTKKVEESVTVALGGKFDLYMSYFMEYSMEVVKEGHYTKTIEVSTAVPSQVWAKDSIFPPFLMVVLLYRKIPKVTLSFEGKNVGKLCYSPTGKLDNFDARIYISDKEIRNEIDQALKAQEDEIFNKLLSEAAEFEKKNMIREAIKAYEEALALRKNDQFVRPKLKELTADLKNLDKEAMLEAEFLKLLKSGDDNLDNLKFSNAIYNYKAALAIRPGNKLATDKMANAQRLLDAENAEKAKLDAEFERLLTRGNEKINDQQYAEAIDFVKMALKIKPENPTALGRLAYAEQLLAKFNADKAQMETRFNSLISAGDGNVVQMKYEDAIGNFNGALKLKPGNVDATTKLANAEKLLAQAMSAKAKLEAYFNRLLKSGDSAVSVQKYTDAISSFKGALEIKSEDKTAAQKLANAEQLLARMNADKARLEAEFNRLLVAGDENVAAQKYAEAIVSFKGALGIRPGDQTATSKLANAEQLLAKLNAEKVKLESEFERLLADGDQEVINQKYAEGIQLFKNALTIKPGNSVATDKIKRAEQLLAKAIADKERLEVEFNRLLAAGDAEVSAKRYVEAIGNFKGALAIKVGEKTATAKLANAEQLLANLNADKAKQEAEFERLLAEGDKEVFNKKYPEAITNFKDALKIKPGNSVAVAKLNDAEQMLAKVNADKARQEAEFSRLLKAGDDDVAAKKYVEAIGNFKSALAIKAGEKTATDKLANAEQLLAKLNADKAKQEAEFERLLAEGDKEVFNQKYPEGIANFKNALTIKPGDAVALRKLNEAELLLARVNADKAKQEAEFNRLLTAGDAEVAAKKYVEAIGNFKSALAIKAGEKDASAKLANAEQLLAKVNADKAKLEEEFERFLAAGDREVSNQKYPEGILNFKDALKLKPGNVVALGKLSEAEQLLARMNAEKAKQETEYMHLMAAGEGNVFKQKYPDAIANFKRALEIKVGDPTATSKLANAELLLARQIAEKEKLESEFNRFLAEGDGHVNGKKYPEAIVSFKDALRIKVADPVAVSKLRDAEKLLAQFNAEKQRVEAEQRLLLEKQKRYKETILRADQRFAANSLTEAKALYNDAIRISDLEKYPSEKIAEIDALLEKQAAERLLAQKQAEEQRKLQGEGSYLKNIEAGDANFSKSLWTVAIFYYQEALKFKASDKYAIDRIDNCKKMIDGNITAERMQEYAALVKNADADLEAKKYSSSKFYYERAIGILPWESYPKSQLLLVNQLIASTDVNGTEAQYFDAIKKADEAVAQKNIAIARFYYQKAISLKPNEEYPKQQLKRLSSQ